MKRILFIALLLTSIAQAQTSGGIDATRQVASPGAINRVIATDSGGNVTWRTAQVVDMTNFVNGDYVKYDGTKFVRATAPTGGTSQWLNNGNKIYYNTDNVGIGTSNPSGSLHIQGIFDTSHKPVFITDQFAPGAFIRMGDGTTQANQFIPTIRGKAVGATGLPERHGLVLVGEPGEDNSLNTGVVIDGRLNASALTNANVFQVNANNSPRFVIGASGLIKALGYTGADTRQLTVGADGTVGTAALGSGGAGTTYTFNSSSIVNSSNNLTLSGDAATPGNSKYYGTNSSGAKGWFDLSAGSSQWTTSGNNISFGSATTGNIGIGTSSPLAAISVYRSGTDLPGIRMEDGDVTLPNFTTITTPALTANTTGMWSNWSSSTGGTHFSGFSTSSATAVPLAFTGYHGSTAPTVGAVVFRGAKHNGSTGSAALANGEIVAEFRNLSTTVSMIYGNGDFKLTGKIIAVLPTYADEAAAVAAGLASGTMYKTSTGEVRIKL